MRRLILRLVPLCAALAVAGLALTAPASASTASVTVPAGASPQIESGIAWAFENYSNGLWWSYNGSIWVGYGDEDGARALDPTGGTWQQYTDPYNDGYCLAYDANNDTLYDHTCSGAPTYTEWRSEEFAEPKGDIWLIWNEWMTDTYPDFCGNSAAVVITQNGTENSGLYLACPEGGGYNFDQNQWWNITANPL